jgi:hypothetical protein
VVGAALATGVLAEADGARPLANGGTAADPGATGAAGADAPPREQPTTAKTRSARRRAIERRDEKRDPKSVTSNETSRQVVTKQASVFEGRMPPRYQARSLVAGTWMITATAQVSPRIGADEVGQIGEGLLSLSCDAGRFLSSRQGLDLPSHVMRF